MSFYEKLGTVPVAVYLVIHYFLFGCYLCHISELTILSDLCLIGDSQSPPQTRINLWIWFTPNDPSWLRPRSRLSQVSSKNLLDFTLGSDPTLDFTYDLTINPMGPLASSNPPA